MSVPNWNSVLTPRNKKITDMHIGAGPNITGDNGIPTITRLSTISKIPLPAPSTCLLLKKRKDDHFPSKDGSNDGSGEAVDTTSTPSKLLRPSSSPPPADSAAPRQPVKKFHSPATLTIAGNMKKPQIPLSASTGPKQSLSRRLSFAPTKNSPIATPPLRKPIDRLSIATAYGIRPDSIKKRLYLAPSSARRTIESSKIIVAVRKRPLSAKELQLGTDVLEVASDAKWLKVNVTRTKLDGLSKYIDTYPFNFDRVYDELATNQLIYAELIRQLVKFACTGGNSTCFAYGQTGSGKTHTMFNETDGLVYLAGKELIQSIGHCENGQMILSFYEIYQGQLLDLLNHKKRVLACEQRDGSVNILWLTEAPIKSFEQFKSVVQAALQTRMTGSTGANAKSSRSHAILNLTLKNDSSLVGKFSFVDLAGSERGADRAEASQQTSHQTKLEGSEINKSLLALKECIRAMDLESNHLPFRQSKLTMVLRDSLIGNARTCMIATVSPASNNCEHTLNTLRYADRMKEMKESREMGGALEEEAQEMEEGALEEEAQEMEERAREIDKRNKTTETCSKQISEIKSHHVHDNCSTSQSSKVQEPNSRASASQAIDNDSCVENVMPTLNETYLSDKTKGWTISRTLGRPKETNFANPNDRAEKLVDKKTLLADIRNQMEQLWREASLTCDLDMLCLLKEELRNLHEAFSSLS